MKALVDTFTQEMALVGAIFEIVKSLRTFVCSSSVDGDGWCKSSITLIIVTNNPAPAPGTASILARAESVPRCQPSLYTMQCVVYIIVHGADMLPMFDITLLGKQGLFAWYGYLLLLSHTL